MENLYFTNGVIIINNNFVWHFDWKCLIERKIVNICSTIKDSKKIHEFSMGTAVGPSCLLIETFSIYLSIKFENNISALDYSKWLLLLFVIEFWIDTNFKGQSSDWRHWFRIPSEM